MALADGLVGYWSPWLGSSGYRLLDRTQYANHGTLTNMDAGTDWVGATIRGKSGYALDYDGTNDYIQTTNAMTLGDFTVAAWFWPIQNAFYTRLVDKNFSTGFWTGRNSGTADWGGGIMETSPPYGHYLPATYSAWNFLCMRRKGTAKTVFVGKFGDILASTSATVTSSLLDATTVRIGFGSDNSNPFRGYIADSLLASRAYSDAEVQQLYRLGPGWYQPYQKRGYGYAAAGFKAYWHRRQQQVIGGGLR